MGTHICGPGEPRCLNECDDPGQVPPLVGQSASVAAGDLGGGLAHRAVPFTSRGFVFHRLLSV